MKKYFAVIALSLCLTGCTDPDNATRILTQAGYTNIQMTGYKGLACGKDDIYMTGFTATGPTGLAVSGCVCAGAWKNSTIRFE